MPVARAAMDTVIAEQRAQMDRADAAADMYRRSDADTATEEHRALMASAAAENRRIWTTEDQRAILESEKWREAASLAGPAGAGLGRGTVRGGTVRRGTVRRGTAGTGRGRPGLAGGAGVATRVVATGRALTGAILGERGRSAERGSQSQRQRESDGGWFQAHRGLL